MVVIQESTCRYLHPVHEDFVARCARPSQEELARFQAQLRGRGKGRLGAKGGYLCRRSAGCHLLGALCGAYPAAVTQVAGHQTRDFET